MRLKYKSVENKLFVAKRVESKCLALLQSHEIL